MYVTQSNSCSLPNSETPLSQAAIDAQNRRVARTGNKFVRGNFDLGDICNGLTPPTPTGSCDDLTSSLAMLNSGPFPIPPNSPTSNVSPISPGAAALSVTTPAAATAPTFADLVAALQGGSAAPAVTSAPSTAAPGTLPGSNGGATPAAAPVTPAPGGGFQICIPRMYSPASSGMSGYRRRPARGGRGMAGLGRGLGDYLMPGAVRLIDGTVISDPANTTPTPAQCLPYQCGADPSNQAARYWCSYYGQASSRPPCSDPSCAPWKPAYCSAPPPAPPPPPPAVAPPPVYPYGQVQIDMEAWVPPRCNGVSPAVAGGVRRPLNAGNQLCFSLDSPVLWGTIAALGLGLWAVDTFSKGKA